MAAFGNEEALRTFNHVLVVVEGTAETVPLQDIGEFDHSYDVDRSPDREYRGRIER